MIRVCIKISMHTLVRALDIPPTPECFSRTSSRISIVSTTDRVSSLSLRRPEPRFPLRMALLSAPPCLGSLCLYLLLLYLYLFVLSE